MTLTLGRKSYTTRTAAYYYADKVGHKSGVRMYVHKDHDFWVAEPRGLYGYDVPRMER